MIVKYDFLSMTEKDVFEMKLKDVIPEFGYITNAKRLGFLKFLVDNKFMERAEGTVTEKFYYGLWIVLTEFRYERMINYHQRDIVMAKDQTAYTDRQQQLSHWRAPNE